jgi:hypothetical protein
LNPGPAKCGEESHPGRFTTVKAKQSNEYKAILQRTRMDHTEEQVRTAPGVEKEKMNSKTGNSAS